MERKNLTGKKSPQESFHVRKIPKGPKSFSHELGPRGSNWLAHPRAHSYNDLKVIVVCSLWFSGLCDSVSGWDSYSVYISNDTIFWVRSIWSLGPTQHIYSPTELYVYIYIYPYSDTVFVRFSLFLIDLTDIKIHSLIFRSFWDHCVQGLMLLKK